jgi:hypothetical protein
MTLNEIRERVARAICAGCEENPDHQGDGRGNDYRWQDYLGPADAALDALGLGYEVKDVEMPNFAWIVNALLDFADCLAEDNSTNGALLHQARVLRDYLDAGLQLNP